MALGCWGPGQRGHGGEQVLSSVISGTPAGSSIALCTFKRGGDRLHTEHPPRVTKEEHRDIQAVDVRGLSIVGWASSECIHQIPSSLKGTG